MTKLLTSVALSLTTLITLCQDVKTSDGVVVGDREYIIASYMAKYDPDALNENVEIDQYDFYACFCDNVIPHIHSCDLIPAMKSNDIQSLMKVEKYNRYFSICFDRHMKMGDDFSTADLEYDEEMLEVMNQGCLREMRSNPDLRDVLSDKMMVELCDCMMEKVAQRDIKMGELQKFDNTDTEVYNEIAMACFDEIATRYDSSSSEDSPEVVGTTISTSVPLIYISGEGYKVKLEIGGIKRYFILDTGASDLVITEELLSELQNEGVNINSHAFPNESRELADGSIVIVKRVRLKEVQVGGYQVKNIIASVVEQGSPLCGMDFLNAFSNWEMRPNTKELILYR